MSGLKIDTRSFDQASSALVELARKNTLAFAKDTAQEVASAMKPRAAWKDQRGQARARLYAEAEQYGTNTTIRFGGSAPNYKQGKKGLYPDYMELLEFANGGRFAVIYPLRDELAAQIRAQYGYAALRGMGKVKILRSKSAMRARAKAYAERKRR